jgi:hypothetical protein
LVFEEKKSKNGILKFQKMCRVTALYMCACHACEEVTMKHKHLVLIVEELMDDLTIAKWFTSETFQKH